MNNPIFDAFGGRKVFLVFVAVVCITILAVTGDIPAKEAVNQIVILTGIGTGAVALEDSLRRK